VLTKVARRPLLLPSDRQKTSKIGTTRQLLRLLELLVGEAEFVSNIFDGIHTKQKFFDFLIWFLSFLHSSCSKSPENSENVATPHVGHSMPSRETALQVSLMYLPSYCSCVVQYISPL